MDRLSVSFVPGQNRYDCWTSIRVQVNGSDLTDLVREFERGNLQAQPGLVAPGGHGGETTPTSSSSPDVIGGYDWLAVANPSPDWVELTLLGAHPHPSPDGRTVLLICSDCREDGCWPMRARIEIARNAVHWRDFGNPHLAERDYSDLSFTFERAEYEREISSAFRFVDRALCDVCDHLCAGGINRGTARAWCRCCPDGERMEPCCCREPLAFDARALDLAQ